MTTGINSDARAFISFRFPHCPLFIRSEANWFFVVVFTYLCSVQYRCGLAVLSAVCDCLYCLCGFWTNKDRQAYTELCITTNQPDTKSNHNPNPNPNPTTKQHAVMSIRLNDPKHL